MAGARIAGFRPFRYFYDMPIPELNEDGVLPEGIHDCTLDEIGEQFGRFQTTDRRIRLFEKLCALVKEERTAGIAIEMIIDGSFVTDKQAPGDIDLVIVLPEGYNFGVELPPFRYNAVSESSIHRRYRFDIVIVTENSLRCHERIKFFQGVREDPNRRKGVLRIKL